MYRAFIALFVSAIAAASAACGSSSQNVTSPSVSKCTVTGAAAPGSFSASGGAGTLTISTNRECQWNASAANTWIQLNGSSSGQGNGSVPFNVAPNADPSARKGAIKINDLQIDIAEDAAPCVFTITPRADSVSAAGDRKTIAVAASSPQCTWTARSDVDWLAIVDGAQGAGNGQVKYEARATTGPSRSGSLTIAGQVVSITQTQGCTLSFTPANQGMPASGGTGNVAVATDAGCSWSARSDASWIAITSGVTGTGAGSIAFTVAASDGPARTGTLTIEGHTFTVSQASGCHFTIDPASESVPAAGGAWSVDVHAGAGCDWTASSSAGWLTISSGASGSGDGRVQFAVAASTGPARSAALTIAGQAAMVNQASGCWYALAPGSLNVSSDAGSASFAVNTSGGCPWTAATQTDWMTITGGSSGNATGTVSFSFTGNPMGGPVRTGTIAVNDQTFTLNQDAGVGCVYSLSPAAQNFPASGGAGSFEVSTVLTCPWTAYSNDSWITITGPPSGAGIGVVNFAVAENPAGGSARVGTISVRGQTFTVSQPAGGGE